MKKNTSLITVFVCVILLLSFSLSLYTFSQNIDNVVKINPSDSLEVLRHKKEILEIHSKLATKDNVIEYASIIFGIVSSIGGILAFLGVTYGLKTYIKERTEKYLKEETEKGLNEIVEKRYGELLAELKLKQNAKILIINEKGTSIPEIFNEILKEFPLNTSLDVNNIEDLNSDSITTFTRNFDLVILEDMVSEKRWLENPRKNLSPHLTEDIIKKNNEILIDFCKKVSPTTAVLYYGDGLLAKESIGNTTIEQYISFANTPATLLQNVASLIKIFNIGKSISS